MATWREMLEVKKLSEKDKIKKIHKNIDEVYEKRIRLMDLMYAGKLSQENWNREIMSTVYEILRTNLLGYMEIKESIIKSDTVASNALKVSKDALSVAWVGFAIAFFSIGITVITLVCKS